MVIALPSVALIRDHHLHKPGCFELVLDYKCLTAFPTVNCAWEATAGLVVFCNCWLIGRLLLAVDGLQLVIIVVPIIKQFCLQRLYIFSDEAVTSLSFLTTCILFLRALILSIIGFILRFLELLALEISKLHHEIVHEIVLVVVLGVSSVEVIVASALLRRLSSCLFFAQSGNIAGPFYSLQQCCIVEVENPVIVKLDLEVLFHELVDILDLIECEPLEHSKTVSIVEHIEGSRPTQHLHSLEFA